MDVCELQQALQKHSTVETPRPPLVPAENKNGTTRRSKTREVSSRYRSPTPSKTPGSRRCSSPITTRTATPSAASAPKRSVSAERKRPSSPSPSTPVQDTAAEMLLASKKIVGNKLPESLWPSTMRSLNVSFQSDSISVPVSKKEKPAGHALSDRTLRSSSNVAQKQSDTAPSSRKPTPERKRSTLKGKNAADQTENSRPGDSLNARLLDQHRWPSRAGSKISSSALTKPSELADKSSRVSSFPHSGTATPSLRRWSLDGAGKPLQKSTNDFLALVSRDGNGKLVLRRRSSDDSSLQIQRPSSSSSSERISSMNAAVRSQSLLSPGSRAPSPSVSRGLSSLQTKAVNPASSRGSSPARGRPSSPSQQSPSSTSVLSFIADIKKGNKAANHIEDVHQLRLLYNRHLQWRYANARANAALRSQKVKTEKKLYSVWRTTTNLLDSIMERRMDLQQLQLRLKLYLVLRDQLAYLDEWASTERDHTNSLSCCIQDLQSCTLRLPVTRGAKGNIDSIKAAIRSAFDAMQAMGYSTSSILSRVEGMNCLVSELANVAAQQRAMLEECESFLATITAMQVEEQSLRTHLLQLEQGC